MIWCFLTILVDIILVGAVGTAAKVYNYEIDISITP